MAKKLDFDDWLELVDECVSTLCGLGYMDLPDIDYYGLWECGTSPMKAAKLAIKNAHEY